VVCESGIAWLSGVVNQGECASIGEV
jgi:hypothetical protein